MENLDGLSEDKIHELRALQLMAKVHTDASQVTGGNLVLLDINPELYPAQDTSHIKSNKIDRNPVNLGHMGSAAIETFPALQESFRGSLKGTERMDTIAKLIKGRNNLAVVTNHGDLTDIALALNLYTIELTQRNDPDLIKKMRTAIILSRIVGFVGIKWGASSSNEDDNINGGQNVYPATDILQYLCDDQFLTLPRTPTIEEVMPRVKIKAHNLVTKGLIYHTLNKGGVIIAVAASGTKDKQVILGPDGEVLRTLDKGETTPEDEQKVFRMAPITSGTADILTQTRRRRAIYTALTALLLKGEKPTAVMCDNIWLMDSQDRVSAGMNVIGNKLGEIVPGHKFINTPVSKDSKHVIDGDY